MWYRRKKKTRLRYDTITNTDNLLPLLLLPPRTIHSSYSIGPTSTRLSTIHRKKNCRFFFSSENVCNKLHAFFNSESDYWKLHYILHTRLFPNKFKPTFIHIISFPIFNNYQKNSNLSINTAEIHYLDSILNVWID